MSFYKKNADKNVMVRLEFPSTDGACWVEVPSRLGFGIKSDIQSKCMVTKLVPPTPEMIREAEAEGQEAQPYPQLFLDPAKAAKELLIECIIDKRAFWNLSDEKDRPYERTRRFVEVDIDEFDAGSMSQILLTMMWSQIGAAEPEDEPKEGDSPLVTIAADPGTSDTDGQPSQNSTISTASEKRHSGRSRAATESK